MPVSMQNNTDLRDELRVCGRTAGAAEAASAEARELRGRVDQLTSMHQALFGRMLRLAVLATQNQVAVDADIGFDRDHPSMCQLWQMVRNRHPL